MTRYYPAFAGLALLALAPAALGQQTIHVRGKEKPLRSTIKTETPRAIIVTGVKEPISADDIIEVDYDVTPLKARIEFYRPAQKAEKDADDLTQEAKRKANLRAAVRDYEGALKALDPGQAFAARHLEFKVAWLLAAEAREEGLPPEKAIAKLQAFKTRHPQSWQLSRVMKLLGDLLLEQKQYAAAEQTYLELARADVAEATKQEAELWAAQVSLRAGKHLEAEAKLKALLAKLPKNSPSAMRARIAQAECLSAAKKAPEARKMLLKILAETKNRNLKAAAYNALGQSYFDANMLKEARWDFLWVDVVYNQDKAEHAKALYYLMLIFDQLNEPIRAQECREALLGDHQFLGSEYQRQAREKKSQ